MSSIVSSAERTLPHNLEAERSVLGVILVHNDAYERIAQTIKPRDFYRDAHRRIFEAMRYLLDERKVGVDFVTLKAELVRRNDLDEVGGPAYVSSLADGVPRETNVEYYAGLVKEMSTLREVIYAANKMLTYAYEANDPSADILRAADRTLLDIQHGTGGGRLVDLRTLSREMFSRMEKRVQNRGALTGLGTGFASIDAETLGWQPADLIIIGARPSIGKTMFALNTAVAVARGGTHVACFSLEMRRARLQDRLVAHIAGVDAMAIRSGMLSSSDYAALTPAMEELTTLPISVDDTSGQSAEDIRHACRRMQADEGLGLIIVDYVQLMPGSLDRKFNRNDQITDISRRLKALAGECGVPLLLMSQLNRANDKRPDPRPKLSDLRESGALEQDADIVAFLHRANHKAGGVTQFILEKQRDGPTGSVNLTLNRDTQTFTDGGDDEPEPVEEWAKRRK